MGLKKKKTNLEIKNNPLQVVPGGLDDEKSVMSNEFDNQISFEQFKQIQLCRQKFKEFVLNLGLMEQKKRA